MVQRWRKLVRAAWLEACAQRWRQLAVAVRGHIVRERQWDALAEAEEEEP